MPSYAGMPTGGRWATSLDFEHDANGNIRTIKRNGSPLLSATFRGAGRPLTRNITLPNGSTLGRAYDYDDATANVGRLSGMRVTVGNTLFAGSSILFEGSQRKRNSSDSPAAIATRTTATTIAVASTGWPLRPSIRTRFRSSASPARRPSSSRTPISAPN
jgi:hypothetical protein